MKIINQKLPEVKLIEPRVFNDARGFFFESFKLEQYQDIGIPETFVQDNISRSKYGTLRGLHYQLKHPQGKLVTVTRGEIFDVAVDIRTNSPNFGKWNAAILNDKTHNQLYIPPGFAHGFCVLSEEADFHYKCTDYYYPEDEFGVAWNDPIINIHWPKLDIPIIMSEKDKEYKTLAEISPEYLPDLS